MHENTQHLQAKAYWSNLAQESPGVVSAAAPGSAKIPPKKPTKRIRISTACVNCRHKKIKCDGQVPCAHCEKFRTECIYPVATKPANQEYVETLENRLKSVESHLQGLLSRGWGKGAAIPVDGHDHTDLVPDDGDAASPYTPSSTHTTPPSKSSHGITTNNDTRHSLSFSLSRQFSGATISTPSLSGPDSENDDSNFSADDSIQVLGLLMGNLKVERDGTAQYLPKMLNQKERSYNDSRIYLPTTSSGGHPDFVALDWESNDVPQPYTLPHTLLTPKAIGALMDIYFNSVHTFLPVIHKNSFLTLCHEGQYRVPPFLLMAICAVAARHATDFELQEIPELSNLKSHHALYDHARALLDTFMDVPRLSTIQGLLLLAYYQTKEKRSGQFFRVRMYINLATRMALDMGLHHAILKTLSEIESSDANDGLSNVPGRPLTINTGMNPQISSMLMNARQQNGSVTGLSGNGHGRGQSNTHNRLSPEKRAVIHQENRLAWLGCFFLDGLASSLMGQEYCVSSTTLNMPQLIQEASLMSDTVQGATLIFWYHHLELVQIYRRICVLHRSIANDRMLSRASKGTDMQGIEASLTDWLSNLPSHLIYLDTNAQNNSNPSASGANPTPLPSYYTLYLHRFFYSYKLLLYRPFITSKSLRGDVKDSTSPMAKCSHAATMLTHIGEIIFQNYSWPWPGCGLFAYHMLQAAEIHVYQIVTQSAMDSQSLYYRTMDLIKGYVSLAKLSDLDKEISVMEETVNNFLLAQQQHFVATPASDYTVMSPASPAESVQRMSISHMGGHSSMAIHTQQQHAQNEDTDMFSPLQTHAYPSFETASRVFRQPQSQGPSGLMANSGFSMGFDLSGVSSSPGQPSVYDASSTLPFYNSASPSTGTSTAAHSATQVMFESSAHHTSHTNGLSGYGQSSFMQAATAGTTLSPGSDLLSFAHMDGRVGGAATSTTAMAAIANASAGMSTAFQAADAARRKSAVPPPKPPKRILSQSTGSSSSSGISQTAKPPVPKKPTRLTDAAQPRWIAPRPDCSSVPGGMIASTTGAATAVAMNLMQGAGPGGVSVSVSATGTIPISTSMGSPDAPPPPYYKPSSVGDNLGGGAGPIGGPLGHNRPIKILQPQTTLYGMGTLVNSLGVEQQVHPMPEPQDHISAGSTERGYYDSNDQAFNYLQMNPQLYDQTPPHNRRPLL